MTIKRCRLCRSHALFDLIHLGEQRLSGFPTPEEFDPEGPRWPLDLLYCAGCALLQLGEETPRELLYTDGYGYRSSVAETIRTDLRSVVATALDYRPAPRSWLDIGCNDGYLLLQVPDDIERHGIDPVPELAEEAAGYPGLRVDRGFFAADRYAPHSMDVITAVSMFYDVSDPVGLLADMEKVLAPEGVIVIQQNYALNMLRLGVVDNISHEHVTYFTVRAMRRACEKAGLGLVDVLYSSVNGGCIRTVIKRQDGFFRGSSVGYALQNELDELPALLDGFAVRTTDMLTDLRSELERVQGLGHSVGVIGASTRGGTLLQALKRHAGYDLDRFSAAYERQPQKVGRIWNATGIPIRDEAELLEPGYDGPNPRYLLVSPWFFRAQILQRYERFIAAGGRLIFPLPQVEVIGE